MANIKRLKRLITVLERVRSDPKKRREFDLEMWAEKVPDCGTHMCACGWATTDPVLRAQGLRLIWEKDWLGDDVESATLKFRSEEDLDAAATFFGLSDEAAEYLFTPDAYANKTHVGPVIRRIKSFVRNPDRNVPASRVDHSCPF